MSRKTKTIAISEETYMVLLEFKERTNSDTMDETIRKLIELSRQALALKVLEYLREKKLSEKELKELKALRKKLREEALWLRRW